MSYCINPSCQQPKNPPDTVNCHSCGSKLLLRDRYKILGILGKGGFGATFACLDTSLPGNPLCVVKQLRPSTDDPNVFRMARELFGREAETLGKVGVHPQVPRLLDYFEDSNQFYLVQEYVKGHNLHQEVKKNGPFSEAGVKQFLSELLPILKYIHEQRVIHRDIKPANLIRRETDRKLVLIDFGAVKNQVNTILANSPSQTALTAFAVGTQGFAPPEQMAMRPVYASDIYALGVTCIYLLTAKSPKDILVDPNTGELMWEQLVHVSPPFAAVLKTMLEVSVRHRYKSAQEVLDALDLSAYSDSLAEGLLNKPVSSTRNPRNGETSGDLSEGSIPTSLNSRFRRHSQPAQPSSGSTPMSFQVSTPVNQKKKSGPEITLIKKKNRLDAKTLLESYSQGRRDFAQEELNGIDIQRVKLAGINLYQSNLQGVNFNGCDLANADLGRANLSDSHLKDCNLSKVYFGYADLERADLRGSNLSGANLKYANLRGANLCGANLSDAVVTQEQISHAKTNWLTVMPSGKRGFW